MSYFLCPTITIPCTIVFISVGVEPVKPSQLLKSSNISGSGSTIVIHCEFLDVVQEVSCVLVYREYGSPLLTVVDIPQLLHFPFSLAVDNPENYTFALFGKHPLTGTETVSQRGTCFCPVYHVCRGDSLMKSG